jgi:hypothetical protein
MGRVQFLIFKIFIITLFKLMDDNIKVGFKYKGCELEPFLPQTGEAWKFLR